MDTQRKVVHWVVFVLEQMYKFCLGWARKSQPSVRNYITTIYQIFDLSRHEYPSPALRKRKLVKIARHHGFVNGGEHNF